MVDQRSEQVISPNGRKRRGVTGLGIGHTVVPTYPGHRQVDMRRITSRNAELIPSWLWSEP